MKLIYWLKPGLHLKRWFVLGCLGVIILSTALGLLVQKSNIELNNGLLIILAVSGIGLLIISLRQGALSLMKNLDRIPKTDTYKSEGDRLTQMVYDRQVLSKGRKMVVIGGGTGLSVLLRGMKQITSNISAIVTVADDGGGSGVLREDLGMLPPGDIRSCLLALAEMEPTMEALLQYRFTEGALKGQSFGNLFIASMNGISENFEEAVKKMGEVLAVKGNVYPVTLEDLTLFAQLKNGKVIKGESNIPMKALEENSPIDFVFTRPRKPLPLPEVIEAIDTADAIVLGPGSLFTSIIPNLLVDQVVDHINKARGVVVYLPNLMTQPGETDHFSVRNHVDSLMKNTAQLPDPDQLDLIITTYAMVQRIVWMEKIHWRCIVLDEAQAIKNPSAQQTKQVKKLSGDFRIIMTGTPVENSLSDLWSLFDFLNPGFLGSAKAFKTFAGGLKKNPSGYNRLKKVIRPYILRRMKTDPAIAPDLPAKVEMKTFPELSRQQVVLYSDFVEQLKNRLAATDKGIERKGLILTSLIKFKQICNHPDQYLGTGGFDPEESGKFIRLRELCDTIYAKRERVLVFTQFKEIIAPLVHFLTDIFHRPGCCLHGSMDVKKRTEAVTAFQGAEYVPFMVLSLKAGGVGLNLTRASHVIHFDRWWNPAVENQATDRAFRIGQQKGVLVHKFITKGTVEDHIDAMIESKKEMALAVIPDTTGSWITELDDKKLLEMFSLTL